MWDSSSTHTNTSSFDDSYTHGTLPGQEQQNWMEGIYDSKKLSVLSLPGTHDTMAVYGGDTTQTQSNTLEQQLNAGVRVVDIRCAHLEDGVTGKGIFAIHHELVYQNANLDDVMEELTAWLDTHGSETVLARIKLNENEDYSPPPPDETREETFERYFQSYRDYIWRDFDGDEYAPIPTLGEVRGKIVILQDFDSKDRKYGIPWGRDDTVMDIQDDYKVEGGLDGLYSKWEHIKDKVDETRVRKSTTQFHVNHLSGTRGYNPYEVAGIDEPGACNDKDSLYPDFPRVDCGSSGFCDDGDGTCIALEGTNLVFYDYVSPETEYSEESKLSNALDYDFVGIIMADFPGNGLIDVIIAKNDQYLKRDWHPDECPTTSYNLKGDDNCCECSLDVYPEQCVEAKAKKYCVIKDDWYWDAYSDSSSFTCCYKGDEQQFSVPSHEWTGFEEFSFFIGIVILSVVLIIIGCMVQFYCNQDRLNKKGYKTVIITEEETDEENCVP
eukprot:195044_1